MSRRKRGVKGEMPEIDKEEAIVKERERILESARNEERRLQKLKVLQDEVQGDIDKKESKLLKLGHSVKALEEKKEQLEELEAHLVDKKDELTNQVHQLDGELALLTDELTGEREELNKVVTELRRKEDDVNVATVEKDRINELIAFKEAKMKEQDNEYDLKMQERDTVIDEVKEQKEELNKLQNEIREGLVLRDKQFTDWDKKIKEADENYRQLKTQIHGAESELSRLRDIGKKIAEENDKKQKEISEKEKALDERGKFLNEVAESLRAEANKIRSKDLDKKIGDFLGK